jgi:hypothetical protein
VTSFSVQSQFAHRPNRNDTIDSVCRLCFATVATSQLESDLERKEQEHVCDPWTVEHYKKLAVDTPKGHYPRG